MQVHLNIFKVTLNRIILVVNQTIWMPHFWMDTKLLCEKIFQGAPVCDGKGSYLVDVPVNELIWHLNLMSIFIHSEVEISVEPFQLYSVPMKVI